MREKPTHSTATGFVHILLLLGGMILVAGIAAWSFVVLPNQFKQAQLGAGIEAGITPQGGTGEAPGQAAIPVLLDPTNVTPAGRIQVTVGVPDPVSVRSVEIFLEDPSGLQSSQANLWNINGQGQWFDDVPIPQNAKEGTWKIKRIEITDTQGTITSYSYGTEIFSTFEVREAR